jgi:MFS family permease
VLPEGREANPGRLPDPVGVVLLAGGLALAAFGIVMTDDWGWTSTSFVATMLTAAALVALFVWRCSIVSNPLLDLTLFDSPSFRWANAGTLVFSIGFTAMFLGNVLFLTQVWGLSILEAGLAISVGPLIVASTAPFFGRLAARVGQRRLLLPGGLVWASGGMLLILRASTSSNYVGQYLPAVVLTGLGVSLCLPQLSSAAVQGLPPDRFGSGSAVNQAIRNLGATLGVALVVAFTSDLTPATALDDFRHVWWLLVISGLGVSALAIRLPRHVTTAAPSRPVGAIA